MKVKLLLLLASASTLHAQAIFTHDFSVGGGWGPGWTTRSNMQAGRLDNHALKGDSTNVAGAFINSNTPGQAPTGISSNTYNLSTVGSSLTYNMSYSAFEPSYVPNSIYSGSGYNTLNASGDNQSFRIGLATSTNDDFTGGAQDSFFLAANELSYGYTNPAGHLLPTIDAALAFRNENNAVVQAVDPSFTIEMGDFELTGNNSYNKDRIFYAISQTYTNVGSGLFDIVVSIDAWNARIEAFSGGWKSEYKIGNVGTYTFNNVAHGLSDLTALRPALGTYYADYSYATSGANFDSYQGASVVPEVTSSLLVILGGMSYVFRRRRA
ncbi:MAG: hypothetical protein H7A51_19455 [Akkermansiaceae bacterium]|nr:hypothetical protein [Akkermansiaceae bacterium]